VKEGQGAGKGFGWVFAWVIDPESAGSEAIFLSEIGKNQANILISVY
jgi:hypothetical protein